MGQEPLEPRSQFPLPPLTLYIPSVVGMKDPRIKVLPLQEEVVRLKGGIKAALISLVRLQVQKMAQLLRLFTLPEEIANHLPSLRFL
jgi:hypothetical protein